MRASRADRVGWLTKVPPVASDRVDTIRTMSRARLTLPSERTRFRWYRWSLHLTVLLVALSAVVFGARSRIRSGVDEPATSGPPGPSPAAVAAALPVQQPAAPSPRPSPSPEPMPSPSPIPAPDPVPAPTANDTPASPEPSPESTPEPSPEPTPEPTAEPSPEPTPAPAPTPAPRPVPPPPPTPRPLPPPPPPAPPPAVTARAVTTASLRIAPGQDALITGFAPAGSTVTVIGCAGGCSWLLVATQGGTAWSAAYFWYVTGSLANVGR